MFILYMIADSSRNSGSVVLGKAGEGRAIRLTHHLPMILSSTDNTPATRSVRPRAMFRT